MRLACTGPVEVEVLLFYSVLLMARCGYENVGAAWGRLPIERQGDKELDAHAATRLDPLRVERVGMVSKLVGGTKRREFCQYVSGRAKAREMPATAGRHRRQLFAVAHRPKCIECFWIEGVPTRAALAPPQEPTDEV